ncbi:hypothetical protein CRM22_003766 [Opisthorchis felineus]|uniref:Uncharacterized protein n=1 Tax=Opisthorchis felineus TaxID=147828 RepID=A0A4S2M4Q0_OPIFE|nr:hypothetical protein CRM22_003766 [Opisthorchis felineus]
MFIRAIIHQLDKARPSHFATRSSTYTGSQGTVYLHKAFLEKTILIANLVLLVTSTCIFFVIPMVQIDVYSTESSTNSTLTWLAYSFNSGNQPLYALLDKVDNSTNSTNTTKLFDVASESFRNGTRSRWLQYQAIWPFDFICCLTALVLDIIRRIRRAKRLAYDSAPMFCMSLMLFTSAFVRTVLCCFYYTIISKMTDMFEKLNSTLGYGSNPEWGPLRFRMRTPREFFTVSVSGLFLSMLTLTMILDYMDPV